MSEPTLTLTISGTASQLAAALAALNGTTALTPPASITSHQSAPATPMPSAAPQMPAPAAGGEDDDDSAPVNTAAPAVDVNGLPWDERIHSASKAITANGAWRARKGVDKSIVPGIEAELRAAAGTTSQAVPPPPPPMPVAPVPMTPPTMQPAPVAAPVTPPPPPPPVAVPAPAPVAPPPPPPPAPAPTPVPTGPLDFMGFMNNISVGMTRQDAQGAPLIHADYLASITQEIATAFGVAMTAITDMATQPRVLEMVDYARQLLQRDGRWVA